MEYTVLCLFTTVHVVCFVSKAFMLSYIICKQYHNNRILSANDQILQKLQPFACSSRNSFVNLKVLNTIYYTVVIQKKFQKDCSLVYRLNSWNLKSF